jgi:hypothetical protein
VRTDTCFRPSFLVVLLTALAVVLPAGPAHAVKVPLGENAALNVSVLAQPWAQVSTGAAPTGGASTDFFLRRIRLLIFGNVTDRLSFFVDTDQPNLGRDGNWTPAFFIQDAFLSVKLAEGHWLDAGMILLPFTHHSLQGAVALNTVDYHSALIRPTRGLGPAWRDAGVQARGFVGPLHYRVGVFNGVEGQTARENQPALNIDDVPRAVGHVRYNVLGREEGFFLQGIYFDNQPRLSVGVGADYQPRAVVSGAMAQDALAVGADLFLEYPLGADQALVFQTNAFRYWQGAENTNSGFGLFGEVGYLFGPWEPVLSAEYYNAEVRTSDFFALRPGVNFWFDKHLFNFKAEVALVRQGLLAQAPTQLVGTAQLQLFY